MQVNGDVREVTTVKLMMAIDQMGTGKHGLYGNVSRSRWVNELWERAHRGDQLASHYVTTHDQTFDRFDEAPQVSALEQAARELTASLKELAELQGKVDAQRHYLEEAFGVEELQQALTNN
ncbi:hypothetical protein [Weissella cibaria]|uniref:hypothetical protein n=1 Tax=Weissella cibaria TaxID=137591 RepID=UPI00223C4E9C|nr:hypothetical protein [Weissella cibaria]MCT0021306.1 hypothetical protein [Weissella cibaria]